MRVRGRCDIDAGDDDDDGLPRDCVLNLDTVTAIRPALCRDRITTLSPERMRQVCDALWIAMAC